MARLAPGDSTPDFDTVDLFGDPVQLSDFRDRKLMLSFYRYAACPLCNLRVHDLIERHSGLAAMGLAIVAVFQSPPETIRKYVGRQDAPFPIIPDPSMAHYRRYRVERSWPGLFKVIKHRKDEFTLAADKGFKPGWINGPINRIPADFLIDGHGKLRTCFYGADIGDHIPLELVEAFAANAG